LLITYIALQATCCSCTVRHRQRPSSS